ncbi:site-specific DNA-methyltransferase, partial [Salmonella enterica subsp. enterica serovar Brandenburg]|nr:site-specific DNA-methyltransferase [Salmonella enterica subsp. enterica serovar Brandenburg]
NTNASEILYKNGFKHSAWNTLIENRVSEGYQLLSERGIQVFTIDDYELENSIFINNEIFGAENHLATVPIRNNPQGRSTVSGFSINHEYAIFHRKTDLVESVGRLPRNDTQNQRYNETDENGLKYLWENFRKTGTDSSRKDRPKQFYPIVHSGNKIFIPEMYWNDENDEWDYDLSQYHSHDIIFPIDSTGTERVWKWGVDRAKKEIAHLKCEIVRGRYEVYRRNYINDDGKLPGTWWDDSAYAAGSHGTNLLSSMFTRDRLFLFPKSFKAVIDSLKVAGAHKESLILDYFAGSASTGHAVIAMNDDDNGSRRSILIEQGDYFDIITKPRMLKCIFSAQWKDGKATQIRNKSCIIKTIKIESYEDALNNISLKNKNRDLFEDASSNVKNNYLINYMLQEESKNSLINTDSFQNPFKYKMDIAMDSAGATEPRCIDLIETFNYLIGLHVKSIESNVERGYVRIEGTLPTGEHTLILWRDCDKIGYEELNKYANRFDLYAKEKTFDVIYINGDHNLPTAFTVDEEDGEIVRSLKIRQIEPEFLNLMFAEEA